MASGSLFFTMHTSHFHEPAGPANFASSAGSHEPVATADDAAAGTVGSDVRGPLLRRGRKLLLEPQAMHSAAPGPLLFGTLHASQTHSCSGLLVTVAAAAAPF